MHGIATLQDVADLVGVHKSTVHRALRGDPRVEAATTMRIRQAADSLGYNPAMHTSACRLSWKRSGRSDPTGLIALLLPTAFTSGSYFKRIFAGLLERAATEGLDVLTRIYDGVRPLPPVVCRGEVDAVIVLEHQSHLIEVGLAMQALPRPLRRPIVNLLHQHDGMWSVCADLRGGGRVAMDHLLDLGHRRVVTIDRLAFGSSERIVGCRDAIRARGMDPDRILVVVDANNGIADEDMRLADALDRGLALATDATALLAPHDPAAAKLIRQLAARGLAVPGRMSVMGFDDTDPVLDQCGRNRLTSVALPLEEMAGEAVRVALNPGSTPYRIMLSVHLRVRETTSHPAQ